MKLFFTSLLLALFLSACGSSPKTNYYTMSAAPIPASAMAANNEMRMMVGPISLPVALDQPQLVIQSGANEVQLYEYHRWAGSLKSEISKVLVANLARDLNISAVWSFSQSTQTNYDYQVVIDVQTLESKLGKEVLLDVLWTVKSDLKAQKASANSRVTQGLGPDVAARTSSPLVGRSVVVEPLNSSSIDELVAAQSRAFAKVGNDIAKSIRR